MTDQIPAGLTREEAQAVREWAELSLTVCAPDKPAAKAARVVLAALPSPPRPTLADMTEEERAACMWMQADAGQLGRVVIVTPDKTDNLAQLIDRGGSVAYGGHDTVTPRPDLPRMEWPGDKKHEPAPALPEGWRLANHPDHGRVIVTNTNQESDGYSYCIFSSDMDSAGFDWYPCAPDTLTYLGKGEATPTAPDHLAVGTVIESADDPRIAALPAGSILLDREGDTTTKRHGAWTGIGYTPIPSEGETCGPWTVLHIPKEADQ